MGKSYKKLAATVVVTGTVFCLGSTRALAAGDTFTFSGTGDNGFSFDGSFAYSFTTNGGEILGGNYSYILDGTQVEFNQVATEPVFNSPTIPIIGVTNGVVDAFDINLNTPQFTQSFTSFLEGGGGACTALGGFCGEYFSISNFQPSNVTSYVISPSLAAVPEPSYLGGYCSLGVLGLSWLLKKKVVSSYWF